MQVWGCAAVWNLATLDVHEAALIARRAHRHVAQAAAAFPESSRLMVIIRIICAQLTVPQEQACGALAALSSSEAGQALLFDAGAHRVVLRFMRAAHPSDRALKWAACFLANLVDGAVLTTYHASSYHTAQSTRATRSW